MRSFADDNLAPIGDRLPADHLSPIGERSPSLAQFLALVRRAFRDLPQDWRDLCADVDIRVADAALPAATEPWEHADRDVLGSYCRRRYQPPTIWLYRTPILAFASDHSLPLAAVVEMVLIHEAAHHGGMTDTEMFCIEQGVL